MSKNHKSEWLYVSKFRQSDCCIEHSRIQIICGPHLKTRRNRNFSPIQRSFPRTFLRVFSKSPLQKVRSMCGSPVRFGGSCHAGNFRNPNDCTCPKVRNLIVWPCPKLWLVPELRLILKRGKPRYIQVVVTIILVLCSIAINLVKLIMKHGLPKSEMVVK